METTSFPILGEVVTHRLKLKICLVVTKNPISNAMQYETIIIKIKELYRPPGLGFPRWRPAAASWCVPASCTWTRGRPYRHQAATTAPSGTRTQPHLAHRTLSRAGNEGPRRFHNRREGPAPD